MLPGGFFGGGGGPFLGLLWILRWLGLRLWSRRGTLVFALIWFGSWLILNGVVLVHRSILSDFCTDDKSKKILQRLCLEFSEGSVTGDMCEDLCVRGLVEYKRCLYYENGKKVIEARWRGNPVILKSKLENFSSYEPLGILDYQDTAEELSPLDVVFYATLEVRNSLGLAEEDEDGGGGGKNSSLARLWGEKGGEKSFSRAELTSLWSLLQQEEYTFLRVLQDLSSHVAKVLGSCGHFYAVEFLSAGHAWDQNIFSLDEVSPPGLKSEAQRRWSSREMVHRIALSFLDMVAHFDRDFTHKLHLCDIKPENFAIRKDLTVVAIDVDMAFFEPKMRDILDQNCSSDDDCNFFDCSSLCDLKTGRCSDRRRNNNLQVICEKIFRPWFSPTLLGAKAGLPLQVELQQAVQECSEMGGGEEEREEGGRGGRGGEARGKGGEERGEGKGGEERGRGGAERGRGGRGGGEERGEGKGGEERGRGGAERGKGGRGVERGGLGRGEEREEGEKGGRGGEERGKGGRGGEEEREEGEKGGRGGEERGKGGRGGEEEREEGEKGGRGGEEGEKGGRGGEERGRGGRGGGGDVHQRLLSILTRLLQEGGASGEGGGASERRSHAHTALNF